MAIITFLSDYGSRDYYAASVKAKIFEINPNIQVIDISHHVETHNVAHAAFLLSSVYNDFPKGTVHLVAVNSLDRSHDKYIAVKMDDHYFVGADNGIFSLISSSKITASVELPTKEYSNFPGKDIFSQAAVFLASEKSIYDLGPQIPEIKRMINREVRPGESSIVGNVVHVDHYGNLITNISKEVFERVGKERRFNIKIGRENVNVVASTYSRFDEGDCVVIFNHLGLLEVAINMGDASQLLGLGYDSTISVTFD